jgi:hypothetical protein
MMKWLRRLRSYESEQLAVILMHNGAWLGLTCCSTGYGNGGTEAFMSIERRLINSEQEYQRSQHVHSELDQEIQFLLAQLGIRHFS